MSAHKKILITDRFSQEALLMLTSNPHLEVLKSSSPDLTNSDLTGVHGLIIRSKTQITRELLAKAKDLQVIITCTSGFDHIDLDATQDWGITVMNTPDANIESAAQLTWALVLACASKLMNAHREVKSGSWARDLLVGSELSQKTYGIIGLGRIGTRVAEIAEAFHMNVIAFDPYQSDAHFLENNVERAAYEEVLKQADVLSFHVPRTRETNNMLSMSQFEYIHRGIILINTSRGSVISEQDLVLALEQGWIGACGLDVFEKEPLPRQSKLLSDSRVILTPHIGAGTREAFSKASEQAALQMVRFFLEGSTQNTLPPKADWYGASPPWEN